MTCGENNCSHNLATTHGFPTSSCGIPLSHAIQGKRATNRGQSGPPQRPVALANFDQFSKERRSQPRAIIDFRMERLQHHGFPQGPACAQSVEQIVMALVGDVVRLLFWHTQFQAQVPNAMAHRCLIAGQGRDGRHLGDSLSWLSDLGTRGATCNSKPSEAPRCATLEHRAKRPKEPSCRNPLNLTLFGTVRTGLAPRCGARRSPSAGTTGPNRPSPPGSRCRSRRETPRPSRSPASPGSQTHPPMSQTLGIRVGHASCFLRNSDSLKSGAQFH